MKQETLSRPILDVCPMPDFIIDISEKSTSSGRRITFKSNEGYATIIQHHYQYDEVLLNKLEVSPNIRRRGIGRLLIQAILNYCLEHNIQTIYGAMSTPHKCNTPVSQEILAKIYGSYGFDIRKTADGQEININNLQEHFEEKLKALLSFNGAVTGT